MKMRVFGLLALVTIACIPALWPHSLAAVYDEKKPVTLKGTVTKFDWTNPHVFVFLDIADVTWAVEFPSRIDLKRDGWTQESIHIGDAVTINASLARDGSKQANAKVVIFADGKRLNAAPAPFLKVSTAAKPAPRWPDAGGEKGHVRLGVEPGGTGYWSSTAASILEEAGA